MKVVWTEQAYVRLAEIHTFVASDNLAAADRLVARLIARGEALSRFPRRGRPVPELPDADLRELIVESYRVVYRLRGPVVEILTVFEGHRRLRRKELPEE